MKYIHVNMDNGECSVLDTPDVDSEQTIFFDVYEVPDDFKLELTLDEINDISFIYEALYNKNIKPIKRS